MDVRRNEAKHRYEVETHAGTAVLEYSEPRNGVLDLRHTFVPRGARTRGIGAALVRTALDEAHSRGQHIIPTCPYVAAWIGRHPEYRELIEE